MLESIALEHGTGQAVGRVKGKVSDKTPEAALSYIERTDHANRDIAIEILDKLIPLDEEQRRLEAYLNLLEDPQAQLIECVYIEKLKWKTIAARFGYSVKTAQRKADAALDELVAMYSLVRFA